MTNENKKLKIEVPTKDPDHPLKFELDPGLRLGARYTGFVTRNVDEASTVGEIILILNAAVQMRALT